jgi:hypothetical protein
MRSRRRTWYTQQLRESHARPRLARPMCSRWSHHFFFTRVSLVPFACRAVDKGRTKSCCYVHCCVSLDEWRYRQIDDVLRLLQIRRTGRDATTSDCKRTKHRTRYQNGQNQITSRDMDDRYSVVIGRGAGTRGCAFRCWGSDVAQGRLRLPDGEGCMDLDSGAGHPETGSAKGIIRCPTCSRCCGLADCGCWVRGRLR